MFKQLLPVPLVLCASLLLASPAVATFELQKTAIDAVNQNGSPDIQAGSHPYALTTTFMLNELPYNKGTLQEEPIGQGSLKEVIARLPAGFVGNPNATPKCKYVDFIDSGQCPTDTAIGVDTVYLRNPMAQHGNVSETLSVEESVYNLEPSLGEPAEFGFNVAGTVPVFLNASVRTGEDYGITVTSPNINEAAYTFANKITIWGVPGDPSHDALRGNCLVGTTNEPEGLDGLHALGGGGSGLGPGEIEQEDPQLYKSEGNCEVHVPVQPLLTNPTSCGVSRTGSLTVGSWQEPLVPAILPSTETLTLPPLEGCEKLDFSPTISVTPNGTAGSTPTGLNVDLHVPQESTTNPVGLGEADVKDTTVALPAGMQISPSASDGLQACSDAQIGFKGVNPLSGADEFTPERPTCPLASKIANVKINTPLLEEEIEGAVYLAAPQNFAGALENPFGSLVATYLVAEAPIAGVRVKLPGKVALNEATGQITTTFENTPALPFSDLKLEFYGTDRAPLATPALCGTYNTESTFTPWSVAEPAYPAEIKHPASSFQITSGPELETSSGPQKTPCSDPLPFSPTLGSGTTNINAASFTDLTTTLSREDGQQNIQSVQLHYPAGVSGLLTGVKLCGEQQANEGTCGPESLIGESIVSVGLGNDPYTVVGGKVYLTGPYRGGSFGLSIVNPAKAGPFDLQEGRPVVVRGKIEVNPITSALTITTNPPGSPYSIPTMIEGIPLQIKHVNVDITRPGFTFNPTNCTPQTITGTIDSAEGASSPVSIPFQVTNCGDLKFAPKFAVSTTSKTNKANGASLAVDLSYPDGPEYANIARVKVELPKALPSRLTTLQKACSSAQFEANPAGCPADSIVGHAKAITPLIPVPLEGPAYFVSHGGEAFPSLIIVLQGYGVTVDLVGTTFIDKAGITSSTFKAVPDQPVGSFELTLPQGPYSALAANGNLCKEKLSMPTEFVAQNGAEIHQSTKISVTGCPKAKKSSKHKKKAKKHAHGKKGKRKK
jgi:hypothetical protein